MKKSQTDGYIIVTLRIWEENNHFVSECPELDVASCGDTIDEALDNIKEATLLYINTIEEQGERQRIFHERNIRLHHVEPPESRKIDVRLNEFITTLITRVPASDDPIASAV